MKTFLLSATCVLVLGGAADAASSKVSGKAVATGGGYASASISVSGSASSNGSASVSGSGTSSGGGGVWFTGKINGTSLPPGSCSGACTATYPP